MPDALLHDGLFDRVPGAASNRPCALWVGVEQGPALILERP